MNTRTLTAVLFPTFSVPNVDLPPLCSSRFRPGPPGEQAQAASQFVADVIERCDIFLHTFLVFISQHQASANGLIARCPLLLTHISFYIWVAALS